MSGMLEGMLVLSVEQAVAAPFASCRLADAGARVIKVERPEGDFARAYDDLVLGQSAYYVWLNRGKESLRLDLKKAEDLRLLKSIMAEADVFIQNLKPGALAKMGLGADVLRKRYPRLVICEITGFGSSGPRADMKAYDLIVQAEAGLCSITGTKDGPARVGVSVCDISAGLNAHSAILQGLFNRERTGEGCHIEISLFDSVADWMNVPALQLAYGKRITERNGVNHPSLAPYGAYAAADGHKVIFSVQNQREWVVFARDFLERADLVTAPGFATNMERLANREELDEIIAESFTRLSGQQAVDLLSKVGIACGFLNEVADLLDHPQLRKGRVATPNGDVDVICAPAKFDGKVEDFGPVASLGENDRDIRQEFAPLSW